MVECKYKCLISASTRFIVLIDTWWNVNNITLSFTWIAVTVLIDTWWNVNEDIYTTASIMTQSFNRYMVECKCAAGIGGQTEFPF